MQDILQDGSGFFEALTRYFDAVCGALIFSKIFLEVGCDNALAAAGVKKNGLIALEG
ncbi:hypothetical protein GCD22_01968 [Acidithiobacillus thiooxidans ATCC 19377]|uniref:Uncharacterized protein n=1 Tax=Acidithiobacillus thiooxidans ATCC 19377 TaxID=637390 RepID=A0A5P9XQU2_ACITH|nr:hypothetical protein GCD22_01968 [Acidithiobacillus thiooxidans ATCC 19377]